MKPFEISNNAEFTFKPEGDKTKVTWAMYASGFMCKAMHMCFNMDKMLGEMFDNGLAKMKEMAESESKSKDVVSKPGDA